MMNTLFRTYAVSKISEMFKWKSFPRERNERLCSQIKAIADSFHKPTNT